MYTPSLTCAGATKSPPALAVPASSTPAVGGGDIVNAVPPASSVWDTEEAWNDLGAFVQVCTMSENAFKAKLEGTGYRMLTMAQI